MIEIVTDGSCGRDKCGAWVATLEDMSKKNNVETIVGCLTGTCITRCELLPIIEGLNALIHKKYPRGTKVTVVTDNERTAKIMAGLEPVKMNADLWARYHHCADYLDVTPTWRERNSNDKLTYCDKHAGALRKHVNQFVKQIKYKGKK